MKEKDALYVFLMVITIILTIITFVLDIRTLWFWYKAMKGIIMWEVFGKAFTLSLQASVVRFPFQVWEKIMEEK